MDPLHLENWNPVEGNFGVVAMVLDIHEDGSLSLRSVIDRKVFRAIC